MSVDRSAAASSGNADPKPPDWRHRVRPLVLLAVGAAVAFGPRRGPVRAAPPAYCAAGSGRRSEEDVLIVDDRDFSRPAVSLAATADPTSRSRHPGNQPRRPRQSARTPNEKADQPLLQQASPVRQSPSAAATSSRAPHRRQHVPPAPDPSLPLPPWSPRPAADAAPRPQTPSHGSPVKLLAEHGRAICTAFGHFRGIGTSCAETCG
jgi:hypothetical protein